MSTAPAPQAPQDPPAQEVNESRAATAYRTDPHIPAVVLGILCVVTGALTIAQVITGVPIDWATVGPPLFTGLGLSLILAGTVGLVRRRRRA